MKTCPYCGTQDCVSLHEQQLGSECYTIKEYCRKCGANVKNVKGMPELKDMPVKHISKGLPTLPPITGEQALRILEGGYEDVLKSAGVTEQQIDIYKQMIKNKKQYTEDDMKRFALYFAQEDMFARDKILQGMNTKLPRVEECLEIWKKGKHQ